MLGGARPLDGAGASQPYLVAPDDLATHAAILGMTGSGKTGLLMVLVEEAVRAGVPVVIIDVKGDLPNLLLTFPSLAAQEFAPWVNAAAAARMNTTPEQAAASVAEQWRTWLADWQLGAQDVAELQASIAARVLTPGTQAGEPLHVLSALEQPSELWQRDEEGAREALSAAVSLLLRLIGRDPDPTKSRDHVVLSVFRRRRMQRTE